MREFIFRGKRNDDGGEWHYGGYVHDDSVEPDVHIIMEHRGGMFRTVPVLPETVGQYTERTDINGTRIFEGDLCLCNRNIAPSVDKQKFEIVFDVEQGKWLGRGQNSDIEASQFEMCEIVGSIHDSRGDHNAL